MSKGNTEKQVEASMKCSVCGKVSPDYCTFCSVCGAKLEVDNMDVGSKEGQEMQMSSEDPLRPQERVMRETQCCSSQLQGPRNTR